MGADRSPFEVLGASPWASATELRRAYRARLRRVHPDHLPADSTPADIERARDELAELNTAWVLLRDPDRRREARERWASWPAPTAAQHIDEARHGDDWDEASWGERARRRGDHAVSPRRWPWLLAGGAVAVMALIFVATAYIGSGDGPAVPGGVVRAGVCVRVEPGPSAVVVSCSEANDGRVIAHVQTADRCPPGSTARRLAVGDPGINCLEDAMPTS